MQDTGYVLIISFLFIRLLLSCIPPSSVNACVVTVHQYSEWFKKKQLPMDIRDSILLEQNVSYAVFLV